MDSLRCTTSFLIHFGLDLFHAHPSPEAGEGPGMGALAVTLLNESRIFVLTKQMPGLSDVCACYDEDPVARGRCHGLPHDPSCITPDRCAQTLRLPRPCSGTGCVDANISSLASSWTSTARRYNSLWKSMAPSIDTNRDKTSNEHRFFKPAA